MPFTIPHTTIPRTGVKAIPNNKTTKNNKSPFT